MGLISDFYQNFVPRIFENYTFSSNLFWDEKFTGRKVSFSKEYIAFIQLLELSFDFKRGVQS